MLYLIDKLYGENGLALAREDSDARVVLIQDGVYLDPGKISGEVYAVKEDVAKRGLEDRLPSSIKRISHAEVVDLIVENKVANFC